MKQHAQLTARETSGPLNHLNVNLSGKNGWVWLSNLKRFLRKEETWKKDPVYGIELSTVKGISLQAGTKVSLVFDCVRMTQTTEDLSMQGSTAIQLYLLLKKGDKEFLGEFEEVMHWYHLPLLSGPKDWGAFRKQLNDEVQPNFAYVYVGLQALNLSKHFSLSRPEPDHVVGEIRLGEDRFTVDIDVDKIRSFLALNPDEDEEYDESETE